MYTYMYPRGRGSQVIDGLVDAARDGGGLGDERGHHDVDFDFGRMLLVFSCVNYPTASQTYQAIHSGQQAQSQGRTITTMTESTPTPVSDKRSQCRRDLGPAVLLIIPGVGPPWSSFCNRRAPWSSFCYPRAPRPSRRTSRRTTLPRRAGKTSIREREPPS